MNWDKSYLEMAEISAKHSKCSAKQVGCILVRDNNILSIGINGTLPGKLNCNDKFNKVAGVWFVKDDSTGEFIASKNKNEHHEWSLINEIHAEMNALSKANKIGVSVSKSTAYVTMSPCFNCAKALVSFGVEKIVYRNEYDDFRTVKRFLEDNGVILLKI
ncbi:dCMP deaminase [Bacillus phage vB_BpuM-BpSp]|nr:dCMP deaminase [Bacillus phage vB_BpuM-BpSp]